MHMMEISFFPFIADSGESIACHRLGMVRCVSFFQTYTSTSAVVFHIRVVFCKYNNVLCLEFDDSQRVRTVLNDSCFNITRIKIVFQNNVVTNSCKT